MKRFLPTAIVVLFALYLAAALKPGSRSEFDIQGFGRLPVLHNGRIKPMDSVARNALILIRGKQFFRNEGTRMSAAEWLLRVASRGPEADSDPVFRLHNPDVKVLLGVQDFKRKYFSYNDFKPFIDQIAYQAGRARQYDQKIWSAYQRSIVQLDGRLNLYSRLRHTFFLKSPDQSIEESLNQYVEVERMEMKFVDRMSYMSVLPPMQGEDPHGWLSLGAGLDASVETGEFHPVLLLYAKAFDAFAAGDAGEFNRAIEELDHFHSRRSERISRRAGYEVVFNRFQPFYQSLVLYVICFLLVILSWLLWPQTLSRTSYYLLLLAFSVHTVGLISRMVLQGRPPVTNLYSSAVFVGWASILLGIGLEGFFRNRIGNLVCSAIGFVTLIIAHHLSLQGDTLEMMQAVLDSNFWLSTHVVTVTMGYSATLLAGALAIFYILKGVFTRNFPPALKAELFRMVFGVVCFGLLFSFVGTVLGGIWADQSWGRFWGWDPKENGALLIVLWNAIILHALKGRFIREQGLMVMCVFGNVITSFSWFGVNMLGVGLHSYGFMNRAFVWLVLFVLSQLVIIGLGLRKFRILGVSE
ncbi:MAG: cytochrome c biogenesis protein CcsA [Candidatus Omnitrophica bacterium]|nr:cytochrome c biogenesis protein CcsA [Candidatus Omnitrophota bacterium]